METLQETLRRTVGELRRTSLPISDIIPLLQRAADKIDSLEQEVKDIEKEIRSMSTELYYLEKEVRSGRESW